METPLVGSRRRGIGVFVPELHRGCLRRCSEGLCFFYWQCTPVEHWIRACAWSLPPPLACSMRACTVRRCGPSPEELAQVDPSRALAGLARARSRSRSLSLALALAGLALALALARARSRSALARLSLALGSRSARSRSLSLALALALARSRSARSRSARSRSRSLGSLALALTRLTRARARSAHLRSPSLGSLALALARARSRSRSLGSARARSARLALATQSRPTSPPCSGHNSPRPDTLLRGTGPWRMRTPWRLEAPVGPFCQPCLHHGKKK